jgi:tyrosyl-tRNA synthetase
MIFVSSLATLLKAYPDSCSLVTPQILKSAVAAALNILLAPIQEAYHASPEWQKIALKAYPPPAKKEKKVK